MKGLFKHFALITVLIIHTSWGSVMAAHMLSANLSMGAPNSSHSEVKSHHSVMVIDATVDSTSKPCPNHANMMIQTSTNDTIHSSTTVHDCSNCDCANVASSILPLTITTASAPRELTHAVALLSTTFPDSPVSAILRPPIS